MAESVGMGRILLERFPSAGALLERTEAAWGAPLRRVLLEGPEERLREGNLCQPLLTWYACAVAEALRERGQRPAAVAGYSLGVFAGLAVAGATTLEGALAILKFNREVIRREGHRGAMLAVGGLELAVGEEYAADNGDVAVGVVNGPRSWTLTGTPEGIVRAEMDLRPRALQLFRLPSGWAIHSPLLEFVARAAREEGPLWAGLRPPDLPFLSPFTGEPVGTAEEAGEVLGGVVCRPMRWDRVAAALPALGGALVEASESGFLGKVLKTSPARAPVRPAVRLLDPGAA
jgi:[acyl-carrier-protein] S-malonyltransferase